MIVFRAQGKCHNYHPHHNYNHLIATTAQHLLYTSKTGHAKISQQGFWAFNSKAAGRNSTGKWFHRIIGLSNLKGPEGNNKLLYTGMCLCAKWSLTWVAGGLWLQPSPAFPFGAQYRPYPLVAGHWNPFQPAVGACGIAYQNFYLKPASHGSWSGQGKSGRLEWRSLHSSLPSEYCMGISPKIPNSTVSQPCKISRDFYACTYLHPSWFLPKAHSQLTECNREAKTCQHFMNLICYP